MFSIPPGYTLLEPRAGLKLVVRHGLEPLVERCGLTGFPAPPGAAVQGPVPAAGRAAVWQVEIGDGAPLVVKIYRRGGLFGRIRGNRYFGGSRPLEEIRVCLAAQTAGLRVPAIQCLWIQQAGAFRCRLAAATRMVPGARDLFRALVEGTDSPKKRLRLLAATAVEIRTLHDAGIHHPDLNLGNILVARDAGNGPEIHLIDFDRARLCERPLAPGKRHGALARMYRSLVKLSHPQRHPLSADEKALFLTRYWGNQDGEHAASRRRCRRELGLHRLWWRLQRNRGRINR